MLRVKVNIPDGNKRTIQRDAAKALKKYDEYDSPVLRILGVPFWGPHEKRDSDGEAFHPKTDIALAIGDTVPVTHYHGFGPDDPSDWQEHPVWCGVAKYVGEDERGHWFEAKLDTEEPLNKRVLDDIPNARASSGAVSHLVRTSKGGLIDVWPIGELAIFETNEWKQPANDYAVIELKTEETELTKVEAKAEQASPTEQPEDSEKENETIELNKEEEEMTEEIKNEVPEVEPKHDVAELFAQFDAKMKTNNKALESRLNEVITAKSAPAQGKKITGKYSKNEATDAFLYWAAKGDEVAAKAALQEGTTTEGGYLVPNDFYNQIIAKRDENSIMRQMGATIMRTSRDKIDIPTHNADVSPARTAEEGAYNESEPTFAQVQIEIHKVTDLVKISEELLEDDATNLESWMAGHMGKMYAAWENDAFFVGTGSNEPDGVFQSGTAAVTSDYATTIGASEIPELYFKLAGEYRDAPSCHWAMKDSTLALIYGLTGNNFQFMPTPAGQLMQSLMGKRVFTSSKIAAHTAGLKSMVFGDFSYYGIAERGALSVSRNPFLYQGNGQVGFFWKQRIGGAVLQAEAFQYVTAHA